MKIKAVKLVNALTSSGRTGGQSALIDLDNPSDARFVKAITRAADGRSGVYIHLQDGMGITSVRPKHGEAGDRLFIHDSRIDYTVECPEASPPVEAKKAK